MNALNYDFSSYSFYFHKMSNDKKIIYLLILIFEFFTRKKRDNFFILPCDEKIKSNYKKMKILIKYSNYH